METLMEIFDLDASWHTPGESSIGGDHVGRDAVFAQFGRYGGETGGKFRAGLHYVAADESPAAVRPSAYIRTYSTPRSSLVTPSR